MIKKSRIFGVYEDKKRKLYTINLTPGKRVYGENLVKENGIEYRGWNPRKSKLAAMILKGCPNIFIREGSVVLYLGCSTGTTCSHVSDIVGNNGFIFALDFAPRVMREMIFVTEFRRNIAPILADANFPESYLDRISQVDVLYQDIAQKNQLEIFLKNIDFFLKPGGFALLVVKARSIDVSEKPKLIFSKIRGELEKSLKIVDSRTLEPYELDHMMFICKK